MAILGVLLGITICAVGWCVKEIMELEESVTELKNDAILGLADRVSALERRKHVIAEPAKAANPRRQWNENLPAVEG